MLAREAAPKRTGRAALARAARRLARRPISPSGRDAFPPSEALGAALRRWRPDYGEYLAYRYANPSLLAALPVIAAMVKALTLTKGAATAPKVIDLGCGIGHTSYLMRSLAPAMQIVAADLDFVNLALAQQYVIPDANFICLDAEAGLPFKDAEFDAAFSLDCVHYIRGKHKLAAELAQIGRPDAIHALCHLHNVERANPNQGIPLSADGYARVFSALGGRLYAEPELLQSFSASGSLALGAAADKSKTDRSDAFVYLSLGRSDEAAAPTQLDHYMAMSLSCFSLNGVYQRDGALELRLHWPSQRLRDECCASLHPLAERIHLERTDMEAVVARRLYDVPAETAESLIRAFVIVPQPPGLLRAESG